MNPATPASLVRVPQGPTPPSPSPATSSLWVCFWLVCLSGPAPQPHGVNDHSRMMCVNMKKTRVLDRDPTSRGRSPLSSCHVLLVSPAYGSVQERCQCSFSLHEENVLPFFLYLVPIRKYSTRMCVLCEKYVNRMLTFFQGTRSCFHLGRHCVSKLHAHTQLFPGSEMGSGHPWEGLGPPFQAQTQSHRGTGDALKERCRVSRALCTGARVRFVGSSSMPVP